SGERRGEHVDEQGGQPGGATASRGWLRYGTAYAHRSGSWLEIDLHQRRRLRDHAVQTNGCRPQRSRLGKVVQPGDRLGGELHPLTDGLDRLGALLVRGRVVAEDRELEARSAQRVPQIVRDRRGPPPETAGPIAMPTPRAR